jgi:hypothetical protein
MGRPHTASPRAVFRACLEARRPEIEKEAIARADAVASITDGQEPGYFDGVMAAVGAALDYALEAIENGEERAGSPPPVVLAQVRLAARSGVSLDTVLRRYFAGYTLLGDFIIREASTGDLLKGGDLQRVARDQAALFDRLVAAITEEHKSELRDRPLLSTQQRVAERVERLLAGDLLNLAELRYELDGFHVGLIAIGSAAAAVNDLAAALDRRRLIVDRGDGATWAWLGGRLPLKRETLREAMERTWPEDLPTAVGEQSPDLAGWRLTHQQAMMAWPVASRLGSRVHYSDVALVAAALQDTVLAASLHELYLAPLEGEGGAPAELCRTLRAYFANGHSVTATAAILEVTRPTVRSRLRAAEALLGRPLEACFSDLEVALRLHELEADPEDPPHLKPHRIRAVSR